MNFSECFKLSSDSVSYSYDGKYLANVVQYKLVIRDAESLQVARVYTCVDVIADFQWSPDSQFILCALFDRGIVQIWSIEFPEWICKIDEGSAGLVDVCWSSDSRHILTTWEFYIHITVWSLSKKSVSYIKYPKNCKKNKSFSADGKYLALLERRDFRDCISIFNIENWQLIKHFQCETDDADGIEWKPDGSAIIVWQSLIPTYLFVYDFNGKKIGSYLNDDKTAGIKCVKFDKSSQILTCGCLDGYLRIFNTATWKLLACLEHEKLINAMKTVVYQEEEQSANLALKDLKSIRKSMQSHYKVIEQKSMEIVEKDCSNETDVACGVLRVDYSYDSEFLYSLNDANPECLYIWKISDAFQLHTVLMHKNKITDVIWDESDNRLALVTGDDKLFMWSPSGSLCVQIPSTPHITNARRLKWHPNSSSLTLIGMSEFSVCFLSEVKPKIEI